MDNETCLEYKLIFQDAPLPAEDLVDDREIDFFEKFLDDTKLEFETKRVDSALMKRAGGPSPSVAPLSLDQILGVDLSAPPATNDSLLVKFKSSSLSKSFLERSDARLARATEKVRAFFGEHHELASEAIELFKAARDAERASIDAF